MRIAIRIQSRKYYTSVPFTTNPHLSKGETPNMNETTHASKDHEESKKEPKNQVASRTKEKKASWPLCFLRGTLSVAPKITQRIAHRRKFIRIKHRRPAIMTKDTTHLLDQCAYGNHDGGTIAIQAI